MRPNEAAAGRPTNTGEAPPRTVVSLFSGAGGMDYGFQAAGFSTALAVEMNAQCCKTLRANGVGPVLEKSIFDVARDELLELAQVDVGTVDLVIGGPPCQPFSRAGYWNTGDSKRLDDPRAKTLAAYMDVVEWLQPMAFVLENVGGLAFSGKDEGLKHLLRRLERINRKTGTRYQPVCALLNAADYGVPQLRERFFMIAARNGARFEFPAPRFRGHDEVVDDRTRGLPLHRTAWDALGDLQPPRQEELAATGRWAGLLPSIPEGKNYLWHTDRNPKGRPIFGWRTRYWGFLLKLAKNRPAWTVSANPGPANGPFHWNNRRLSVRELCRIQTFPDSVNVTGTRAAIQRQLGNAVPSLLAEVLGLELRRQIFKDAVSSEAPTLLPPSRGKPPRARQIAAVGAEYRRFEGNHPAHPGTGKGPGARSREKARGSERKAA